MCVVVSVFGVVLGGCTRLPWRTKPGKGVVLSGGGGDATPTKIALYDLFICDFFFFLLHLLRTRAGLRALVVRRGSLVFWGIFWPFFLFGLEFTSSFPSFHLYREAQELLFVEMQEQQEQQLLELEEDERQQQQQQQQRWRQQWRGQRVERVSIPALLALFGKEGEEEGRGEGGEEGKVELERVERYVGVWAGRNGSVNG